LYIVIVPLLLTLLWRERPAWNIWLGAGLAAAGLFLLSVQSEFQLAPGDGWVLAGAFLWALHVIAIGRLAPTRDPLRLAWVQYIVCALLSLVPALSEQSSWTGITTAWSSILYTGVLSIGLGYTAQVVAQRHTPPTHAAIILSLEAAFAAISGWFILGEALTAQQTLGCGLMLAGMALAQIRPSVPKQD
jgi:drug/metabolite transporter (DMT)-like permease